MEYQDIVVLGQVSVLRNASPYVDSFFFFFLTYVHLLYLCFPCLYRGHATAIGSLNTITLGIDSLASQYTIQNIIKPSHQ